MKVWQIIALVVAGFVALFGSIVFFVFQMTGGIVDAADGFFEAAHAGDYEAAYNYTAQSTQQNNTLAQMIEYIEINGFDEVVETSWSSRNINNDSGYISGTVTTESGAVIPMRIDFVQEGEDWKITYIERQDAGFNASPQSRQQTPPPPAADSAPPADIAAEVPKSIDVTDLFEDHTTRFLESVVEEDHFFWGPHWVDGVNFMQLERRFPYNEAQAEQLRPLLDAEPRLASARMNDSGQLVLQGAISAKGITLNMTDTFTREGEEWKMADFEYEVE